MSITRTIIVGVVGALVGIALMLVIDSFAPSAQRVGAVSGMLIENYDPYVRNNGGLNTGLPFQTSSTITTVGSASTLTTGGDIIDNGGTLKVTTSNTATSTVVAGCFQFYATSTATALKFQASTTPGVMYSQYGTCPNL